MKMNVNNKNNNCYIVTQPFLSFPQRILPLFQSWLNYSQVHSPMLSAQHLFSPNAARQVNAITTVKLLFALNNSTTLNTEH